MEDLKSVALAEPWLVVGYFTPNYRPLAERFARSLDAVKAPYHLLAKASSPDGWLANARRKPEVVVEAMELYPTKTILLVDVDAEALGSISPAVEIGADIAAFLKAKISRSGRAKFQLSDRVVVFRPTPGAKTFAVAWRNECIGSNLSGEALFALAWASCPGVTFTPLDARYAARERDVAPEDAVIVHDSARDVSLAGLKPIKFIRRWFENRRT